MKTKKLLRDYQKAFFKSAISRSNRSKLKAYNFTEIDKNRAKAFLDKLERHQVEVIKTGKNSYSVPTEQTQYRMVQTFLKRIKTTGIVFITMHLHGLLLIFII